MKREMTKVGSIERGNGAEFGSRALQTGSPDRSPAFPPRQEVSAGMAFEREEIEGGLSNPRFSN